MRDYLYPFYLQYLGNMADVYTKYIADHPDKKLEYQTRLFGISNSQKAITGYLGGLRDAYLMARKEAFERDFMTKVRDNPSLEQKYGSAWSDLSNLEVKKGKLFPLLTAYDVFGRGGSGYFSIAAKLIRYAEEMRHPEGSRPEDMRGAKLDTFKLKFFPKNFNKDLETGLLATQLGMMQSTFGSSNETFNTLLEGRTPENAAAYLTEKSQLGDSAAVVAMLNDSPEAILNSTDPFIVYVRDTQKKAMELQAQYGKLTAEETSDNILLGRALYDVYGSEIPPDATFTLRIADGVVKGYPYNGTIAPPHTTFYGLYNRYYSFSKKYPWSLPSVWQNPPADFNLSTPLDFVATNDIIGGNSGSAVINENRHVVGLIFDGNIESLPGDFIYVPTVNRSVAVSSRAIPEALKYIYHADRLVNEIKDGKIEQ